jgi:hypothetical protein
MVKDLWPGSWDQDNLLERKSKKQPNVTRIKMSKLATMIMRPGYLHKKQIMTDYEA